MNRDQIKGKLKQLSGEIKRKWGQLTDDDLRQAQGDMEKLIGKIQERSGDQREAIEVWLKSQGLDDNDLSGTHFAFSNKAKAGNSL